MSDTKSKLEEYRKRKETEAEREVRKNAVWNALTLQPLRQRLITRNDNVELKEANEDNNNDTFEEVENEEWTSIDWAIIAVKCLVWVCLQVVFIKIEFGAVFFLFTGIFLMLTNMGKRKAGEMSAYSVFNPNCESIDGTLTAQQFEREIRHGPATANT